MSKINTVAEQLPTLGVGITYSASLEPLLNQCPTLFDVIEVEPQTTWFATPQGTQPYRLPAEVLEHLTQLPGRKIVHSIGMPVGGARPLDPAQLALILRTIENLGAPWFSEHLGFNATSEFSTGFFLPSRQTQDGVDRVVHSIQKLQKALPVPVAVETGVNYLKPRSDEMTDGAFVSSVIERADCGLLLDLHNLFTNELNGRQSVEDFLAHIPLERVWEMHLAGGMEMDGFWLDAHSGEIPDPLFDLAKQVIPALPNLKAVIFEIFPAYIPSVGLDLVREQVERIHELWELRALKDKSLTPSVRRQAPVLLDNLISPETWEHTISNLAVGFSPEEESNLVCELTQDPGIKIINKLICEFRAGMVVRTLKLTSHLMMLALGPDVFRAILEDFWSKNPPQLFASVEAEAFGEYLVSLDLKVPQLSKVLEFERAVVATLIDEQTRLVCFDFDPLPLFRSLVEGRLPPISGKPGYFEIEITSDGPISVTGVDLESVQQAFPFH